MSDYIIINVVITLSYTLVSKFLKHPILMKQSRILSIFLICLFVAGCDTQEQTAPLKKTTEIKTAPEKAAPEKTAKQKTTTMKNRPVMNLSIDNMHIDDHINDDNLLNPGTEQTEKNNTLFETLSKNKMEPKVNLSGKLYTDEDKVENKEYLKSVDGVQINIEGNFN